MSNGYVHGYDAIERARLRSQAEFWRRRLILPGLAYLRGDRVLEIGCGVGAVLSVLAEGFPGVGLAGVDSVASQIDTARENLVAEGIQGAELRLADGAALPWGDSTFDHVFMMWVVEHLQDPGLVFQEAARVLRPGGTITVIETDYGSFRPVPEDEDFAYLRQAMEDLFESSGSDPAAGPKLGNYLASAGFEQVGNAICGFHFFSETGGTDRADLSDYVEYTAAYLAPMIPRLVDELFRDEQRLRRGLEFFVRLPTHPEGAFTQVVYRGTGIRA